MLRQIISKIVNLLSRIIEHKKDTTQMEFCVSTYLFLSSMNNIQIVGYNCRKKLQFLEEINFVIKVSILFNCLIAYFLFICNLIDFIVPSLTFVVI